MALTLNENLVFSTLKITKVINGQIVESGTGFCWNAAPNKDQLALCLVTNKHVINNADAIIVRFHLATDQTASSPSGRFSDYELGIDHKEVVGHPNPNVDLCAVGIASIIPDLQAKGETLFYRMMSAENIPSEKDWQDFDAIEDVIMIGCPNGIVDEFNNRPIIRRGITATQMSKSYNGKPEFMVDMACFPGSSGSPVILNQMGYLDKDKNMFMMGQRRFFLVGVLYAGPLISSQGTITFGTAPSVQVASMMHLGNVIKSSELHALNSEIAKKLAVAPTLPLPGQPQ